MNNIILVGAFIFATLSVCKAFAADQETVFFCKDGNKTITVVREFDDFTFTIQSATKPKPDVQVTQQRRDMALDHYTVQAEGSEPNDEPAQATVSLLFVDGDTTYAATNDRYGDTNHGSYGITVMGTETTFGKCQDHSYRSLLLSPSTMADIELID